MPGKGNPTVVRALNRRLLLKLLRERGPASRTELAEWSGLSAAAVTRQVQDLIAEEFLVEREVGLSTGGRPPVLLDLDTTRRAVVGLKLMEDAVLSVLCDMKGTVLASGRSRLRSHDARRVLDQAARSVDELLRRNHLGRDQLVGVGVCIPGAVNWTTGVCRLSPFFGWRDLHVADLLADRVGVPVTVDNDVNALAVAESLFGAGRTVRDFAVITLGRGVGAGIVSAGVVQRGATGSAGEFGHQVSDLDGLACECGKHGCLEAYCGEYAILTRVARLGDDFARLSADQFVARARSGDPQLSPIYREAVVRLGAGIANLINLLNPELILLGGEAAFLDDQFLADLDQAARRHVFDGLADTVTLRLHGERGSASAWARGAASLAIEHVFDPLIHTHGAASA